MYIALDPHFFRSYRMMSSDSYSNGGLSSFEWFELAFTAANESSWETKEQQSSYNQNGLSQNSSLSTAVPSRSCSSILEPLGRIPLSLASVCDGPDHLDIDPILLHALLQISEDDVTAALVVEEDTTSSTMRYEAEKDFQDWKQTRRLIKRLSRNDSWDISEPTAPPQKRAGSRTSTFSS